MAERFPYEDIVNLSPHISKKHPQPTMLERAARFAPFAAITGYEEMVLEEARVTEERIELSEGAKAALNKKLSILKDNLSRSPEVTVTYFEPDQRKAGGAYLTFSGVVRRVDEHQHLIQMMNGKLIFMDEIYELESELFESLGIEE